MHYHSISILTEFSHQDMTRFGNTTDYGIKSDAIRYTWAGYLLFVLLSSLIGDTIILVASIKYKAFRLHRAIVVIIQHIACCDLMVALCSVVPHFISVVNGRWVLGKFLCDLSAYTSYYFKASATLLVCAMTTSKLLLLKYPIRFGTISVRKAHMLCLACWVAVLVKSVTSAIVEYALGNSDRAVDSYFSYITYVCDFGFTSDAWYWLKPLIAVLYLFIPNCLVLITTLYLVVIAKRVAHHGLRWQGIVTTVLIAVVYCISILPNVVFYIGGPIVIADDPSRSFFHTTFLRLARSIFLFNTISNFYIYSLSVNSFRDFILKRVQKSNRVVTSSGNSAPYGKGM